MTTFLSFLTLTFASFYSCMNKSYPSLSIHRTCERPMPEYSSRTGGCTYGRYAKLAVAQLWVERPVPGCPLLSCTNLDVFILRASRRRKALPSAGIWAEILTGIESKQLCFLGLRRMTVHLKEVAGHVNYTTGTANRKPCKELGSEKPSLNGWIDGWIDIDWAL